MTTTLKIYQLSIILLIIPILSSAAVSQFDSTSQYLAGKVINEVNEPLQGVSISVKATNSASVSDADGRFKILRGKATNPVTFRLIGYETKAEQISGDQVTVILKKAVQVINPITVVSTGYQNIPKERSPGSYTQIDNKLYNQQVGTDVLSRLESVANGLSVARSINPNGKPQFMIRGLSTINGPKDPLIVLDNFPYEGKLENLNPNDIESITLLKDAAAASIWGARAGNGVIVITSKKSQYNKRVTTDFTANLTLIEKPRFSRYNYMNSASFLEVDKFLFSNEFRFYDTANIIYPPFTEGYEILFLEKNGKISSQEAQRRLDLLRNNDALGEYRDKFYRIGVNQQYAISVKGGGEKYSWLMMGGYDRNRGNLDRDFNKYNFKIQNNFIPMKGLNISTNLLYTNSKTISGKPEFTDIKSFSGFAPTYSRFVGVDGHALPFAKDNRSTFVDTAGGGKLQDWKYYPYEDWKHSRTTTKLQDIVANIGLNYTIIDWIKLDVKYQYQQQTMNINSLNDERSYFARNLVNMYTTIVNGAPAYGIPKGGILDYTDDKLVSHNLRGTLQIDKELGLSRINAILGAETREIISNSALNRIYGYNPDAIGSSAVDYITLKPTYFGYDAQIPGMNEISAKNTRFVSLFGNAAYTFNDKYTISASVRRDASNIFGLNTNDKWTPLWSAGLSWDIEQENFFKVDFIDALKLRASYGMSGNVDPSKTAATTITYLSNSPYTQTPIARIRNYYNPELRWEKNRQYKFGLEFSAAKNRVSGSVEYYNKKGTDLYGPSPVDLTAGLTTPSIIKNVASMVGDGWDISLNGLVIDRAIKWQITTNINFNKDKITRYYFNGQTGAEYIGLGRSITPLVGSPVYSVRTYRYGGLDPTSGDPIGYIDGKESKEYDLITGSGTSVDDLRYFGTALPRAFGSLGSTISWNDLTLTVRFTGKFGYYFFKSALSYYSLFYNQVGHSDYERRWMKPGDEQFTDVPSMSYPLNSSRDLFYGYAEPHVLKADHIRLQYINLSYDISKLLKSKYNLSLGFIANDIGVIWRANKFGLDPEFGNGPIPGKSYSLSLRASF